MSTARKLDPNRRAARTRRKTAVAAVRESAKTLRGHHRIALEALAEDLDEVRKDSRLTEAQKDQRFKALMAHVN